MHVPGTHTLPKYVRAPSRNLLPVFLSACELTATLQDHKPKPTTQASSLLHVALSRSQHHICVMCRHHQRLEIPICSVRPCVHASTLHTHTHTFTPAFTFTPTSTSRRPCCFAKWAASSAAARSFGRPSEETHRAETMPEWK
jgi:hypothetical protein